jgi:hypothetical protein
MRCRQREDRDREQHADEGRDPGKAEAARVEPALRCRRMGRDRDGEQQGEQQEATQHPIPGSKGLRRAGTIDALGDRGKPGPAALRAPLRLAARGSRRYGQRPDHAQE